MISFPLLHSYTPSHVFLIQGGPGALDTLVQDLKQEEISHSVFSYPSLTIDIAKELRTLVSDFGEGQHWVLVSFSFFTKDAADVFLKLLEEPYSGMHIILCTPYPYLVPDTIRSRVLFLTGEDSDAGRDSFFTRSVDEKLDYIKKYFGTDAEDEAAVRKVEAFVLLDGYEKVLHSAKRFSESTFLYDAKRMIAHAGIPPKQALEYVVTMLG
jgi:hypothetical protein